MNGFSDIKLACGLKSYSIRLTLAKDNISILLCFTYVNTCFN